MTLEEEKADRNYLSKITPIQKIGYFILGITIYAYIACAVAFIVYAVFW